MQRPDDSEKAVLERLDAYHRDTAVLKPLYREQGLLRTIDGTRSPNDVSDEIQRTVR